MFLRYSIPLTFIDHISHINNPQCNYAPPASAAVPKISNICLVSPCPSVGGGDGEELGFRGGNQGTSWSEVCTKPWGDVGGPGETVPLPLDTRIILPFLNSKSHRLFPTRIFTFTFLGFSVWDFPCLLGCQVIPKHTHMVQAVATRVLYQTRLCSSTVPWFKSIASACSQAACYF